MLKLCRDISVSCEVVLRRRGEGDEGEQYTLLKMGGARVSGNGNNDREDKVYKITSGIVRIPSLILKTIIKESKRKLVGSINRTHNPQKNVE